MSNQKPPKKQKSPGPEGFTGELHRHLKNKYQSFSNSSIKRTEEEETLPNSFYEVSITLISKPDKDTTRK